MYYGRNRMRTIRVSLLNPRPHRPRYWTFFRGATAARAMQWNLRQCRFQRRPTCCAASRLSRSNVRRNRRSESLLNTYKQLLALRRANPVLIRGDLAVLDGLPRDVLAYHRFDQDSQALVLLNMGTAPAKIDLPAGHPGWHLLWGSSPRAATAFSEKSLELQADEALILAAH